MIVVILFPFCLRRLHLHGAYVQEVKSLCKINKIFVSYVLIIIVIS